MPVRKKLTKAPPEKEQPIAPRPIVTQVVEVVEIVEETEEAAKPSVAQASRPGIHEEKKEVKEPVEEKPSELEEVGPPQELKEEVAEKKKEEKEVISDLFNKNDTVGIPEISMHKNNSSRTMIMWSTAVITVAVLLGGVLLVSTKGVKLPLTIAKPTPTPTQAPSPTPEPAKREDISVQVLNGGGVAGAATKMKSFLVEKGYKVDDVGNTDDYTYDKTALLVKSGKDAYAVLLKEDLSQDYTLEASPGALSSDSLYDAQVIVGKE